MIGLEWRPGIVTLERLTSTLLAAGLLLDLATLAYLFSTGWFQYIP